MKILVFDTETTDLCRHGGPPPFIVQLSFVVYDMDDKRIHHRYDEIIHLTDTSVLTSEAIGIHGITRVMASGSTVLMADALREFFRHAKTVDLLVGHNVDFDCRMIKHESDRNLVKLPSSLPPGFCTMKESVDLCKIQSAWGTSYKWPKLVELYVFLFGGPPNEKLHNAMHDVRACLKCFIEMHRRRLGHKQATNSGL